MIFNGFHLQAVLSLIIINMCGIINLISNAPFALGKDAYQLRWHKRSLIHATSIDTRQSNANQVTRTEIFLHTHFTKREDLITHILCLNDEHCSFHIDTKIIFKVVRFEKYYEVHEWGKRTCNQDRLIISTIKIWIERSQNLYPGSESPRYEMKRCLISKFSDRLLND